MGQSSPWGFAVPEPGVAMAEPGPWEGQAEPQPFLCLRNLGQLQHLCVDGAALAGQSHREENQH